MDFDIKIQEALSIFKDEHKDVDVEDSIFHNEV
jgi:hypothetical protein